jgi:gliding motility-associated-like protein
VGSHALTYLWSDGSNLPARTVTQPGMYSVTVSNSCGSSSDTIVLTERPAPVVDLGLDTAMCWGQTLTLSAGPGHQYLWSDGSTTSTLTVTGPGLYSVVVRDDLGCAGSDEVFVDYNCVAEIHVPTAFTPNAAPPNDDFRVYGDEPPAFEISIFNRWGEKIFYSDDFGFSWDGTLRGEPLPISVYVYLIRYRDFDGTPKQLQGNITLIR